MTSLTTRRLTGAGALVVALALAGCSGDDGRR